MAISYLEKEEIRKSAMLVTVDQYHKLCEAGIIDENLELIEGIIVKKMPKSPRHTFVTTALIKILEKIISNTFFIRQEQPLTLEFSEPEPDIAVIKGTYKDYSDKHPSHAELVIEVSHTTLKIDQSKANIYASAGVPDYWIVNLENNTLEIYTKPINSEYSKIEILSQNDRIQWNGSFFELKEIF